MQPSDAGFPAWGAGRVFEHRQGVLPPAVKANEVGCVLSVEPIALLAVGKVECFVGSGVDLDPCCGVGEGAGKGFALDGVVIEIQGAPCIVDCFCANSGDEGTECNGCRGGERPKHCPKEFEWIDCIVTISP